MQDMYYTWNLVIMPDKQWYTRSSMSKFTVDCNYIYIVTKLYTTMTSFEYLFK